MVTLDMNNLIFNIKRWYYHKLRARDEKSYKRLSLVIKNNKEINDFIKFDKKGLDYWDKKWD